jgi:ubiquinone/menaquinone biosynthesis C-methylase UbiE
MSYRGKTYQLLDIGCGAHKCSPDATGIDVAPAAGVDIVGDALAVLRQMDSESVQKIYSSHFLEHHEHPSTVLREMVRVLKVGGQLELRVPHRSDPWYYSDPTHKHFFGLYSFAYYFHCTQLRRELPQYCRIDGASIQKIALRFGSTRPFYLRHALKKLVQLVVNLTGYFQELYEEALSSLVPCSEVYVLVVKEKHVEHA